MSGICSAHQHHEPGCERCDYVFFEKVVLERTGIAQGDFDSKCPTGSVPVTPSDP